MRRQATLLTALLLLAAPLAAQDTKSAAAPPGAPAAAPPKDPAMAGFRPIYNRVKDIVVRAAEKMPEESYSFKATPEVRTFAGFVGHVADANHMFCGVAVDGKPEESHVEKTMTAKADLVKALKESFATCDRAFAMTDAEAARPVMVFGREGTRFTPIALTIGHDFEHYGNMVTYLRMKGIVPPSSEQQAPPPKPEGGEKK